MLLKLPAVEEPVMMVNMFPSTGTKPSSVWISRNAAQCDRPVDLNLVVVGDRRAADLDLQRPRRRRVGTVHLDRARRESRSRRPAFTRSPCNVPSPSAVPELVSSPCASNVASSWTRRVPVFAKSALRRIVPTLTTIEPLLSSGAPISVMPVPPTLVSVPPGLFTIRAGSGSPSGA